MEIFDPVLINILSEGDKKEQPLNNSCRYMYLKNPLLRVDLVFVPFRFHMMWLAKRLYSENPV